MNMLLGKPVQISASAPRMQVSTEFARLQSPELVASTNAWMREFFGYDEIVPDGVVYQIFNGTLVMNQRTYDKAKRAAGAA